MIDRRNWILPLIFWATALAGVDSSAADDLYYYDAGGRRVALELVGQDDAGQPQVLLGGQPLQRPDAPVVQAAAVTLSDQFVVRAAPGTDPRALAQQWGVTVVGQHQWNSNYYILQADSPWQALRTANAAWERGQVVQVFTQFEHSLVTRQAPNDPLFGDQWHLRNTGQGGGQVGHDLNVQPVWNFGNGTGLGSGVTVGIVDTRVQLNHPDLADNIRSDRSLWSSGSAGSHGTAVAGLVGAVGNNGAGGLGVAPGSWLAPIGLLNQSATDSNQAIALTHHYNTLDGSQFDGIHVYNNSWGPSDNATRVAPGPLVRAALEEAVTNGRNGLGNIYVWAGGNGGNADNVNYDGYANSRYTIAVGATTNHGVRASYSERGAALLVNAGGHGGSRDITTTTTNSGYTSSFGGTSASSPMVAGTVALMLEANPNLTWRDVQHILVETSRQNDSGHTSWIINGSGRAHSDFYGFGTVDAAAAVQASSTWTRVADEILATGSASVGQVVPDGFGSLNNPGFGDAVFSSIDITQQLTVEHVEVIFNTSDGFGGDLEVVLFSPMGTESTLAMVHNHGADYDDWTFMTVKNWGERSDGTWTLRVRDGWSGFTSTWDDWTINVYGTAIPEPAGWPILVGLMLGIVWLGSRHRRARTAETF